MLTDTLGNGLRIRLKQLGGAPVASVGIWYCGGSRNDSPGKTGVAHWLEHLTCKRSRTSEVTRNGGVWDAFTGTDYTVYRATVPADRIDVALGIAREGFDQVIFDSDDINSERGVILAERESCANQPGWALSEKVLAASYLPHPYGNPVIGWKEDLYRITWEDIQAHYTRFYVPQNCVLVVAGEIDIDRIVARIDLLFSDIKRGIQSDPQDPCNPIRRNSRAFVPQPFGAAHFHSIHHGCAATEPDVFALLLLMSVLTGRSLQCAPARHSSRLYRCLVETGVASSVVAHFRLAKYRGPIHMYGTLRGERSMDEVESRLEAEIDRLRQNPISHQELDVARRQILAEYAYSSESVTDQARWLGRMAVLGEWDLGNILLDRIAAVTAGDTRRVAQAYLSPESCTMGSSGPIRQNADNSANQREHSGSRIAP